MGDLDNWQTTPLADTLVVAFESIGGGQILDQRDGTFTKILQRLNRYRDCHLLHNGTIWAWSWGHVDCLKDRAQNLEQIHELSTSPDPTSHRLSYSSKGNPDSRR
jgi:hypothetical protein